MRPCRVTCPNLPLAAKSDPRSRLARARHRAHAAAARCPACPAHRDFYKQAKGHDAVIAPVMAEPLIHEPGKQIEYSDLGFILLGEIIQRLTGETLEEFAKRIFSLRSE